MDKIKAYGVATLIIFYALIPPIPFHIPNPNFHLWVMMAVLASFAGFCILFLKTNLFIKAIAIGALINCFISRAPYIAFTAYVNLMACCYFYILCTRIKDWNIIFKAVLALVAFNIFFMAMQFLGKDSLLNFSAGKTIISHGVIGSRMQTESFLLVALALIIAIKGISWKAVLLSVLSLVLILCIYTDPILHNPLASRLPVWDITIKLANQHPIAGWGIGTYKDIFFPLSGLKTWSWVTAHNDFLQVLFECGYPGFVFMIGALGFLFYRLRKEKLLLICLSLITIDMSIHFPTRVANTVLIWIAFLSYCERKIKEKTCLPQPK